MTVTMTTTETKRLDINGLHWDDLFRLRYSWNWYDAYDIAMDYRVGLNDHADSAHDLGVNPQTGLTDFTVWNYHLDLLNVIEGNDFQHLVYVLGSISSTED